MTFTVYGVAQPKGSTRAILAKGMKRPIVTDSNRNAKAWQQLVAEAACRAGTDGIVIPCACRLSVVFYLPRPKKFQRAKHDKVAHVVRPDVDKLARAVLDALTAVVFLDDSQIVDLHAAKRYAEINQPAKAVISVSPV